MPQTREELAKQTVAELKAALKALGRPVTGKKDELVERMLQATAGDADAAAAPASTAPATTPAPVAPATAAAAPVTTSNDAAGAAPSAAPAEPASEDAGTSAGGKRPKIQFNEQVIKQMPTKVTVIGKATSAEPPKPVKTIAEKLKERADKFKDPDVEKVKQRAERFGLFNEDLEKEKARKRAERFGTYNADLDEERKQKRAARFGVDAPEAKLAARAERFKASLTPAPAAAQWAGAGGDADVEARRLARAARFAVAV